MRLFDFERAPNPRRVRMFIAEKALEIPRVPVNLYAREQLTPEFLKLNPAGMLPVLETDDGNFITESLAICQYLERLHPEPALIGPDPLSEAMTLSWNNVVEHEGLNAVAEMLRNWSPGFRDHALPGPVPFPQIPALRERGQRRIEAFFARIEQRLENEHWLAGGNYSLADISLLATVDFSAWVEMNVLAGRPALQDWYARASARPSAAA